MLTLVTNAQVFAPDSLGTQQVLIAGDRIAAVADEIDVRGDELDIVDAEGGYLLPGIIDVLTHPCGGGGEGGFQNRTGEVTFEEFVQAGVTSPVGALGTDSITRSLDVLYGTTMGLRRRGLAAFMYTGSYRVPADTLTGDVARDITLIDPVLGVGEVAISDHRSSQPTASELRRIAADAQLGGIISGKGGTVLVHVGDGAEGLAPIHAALESSELPVTSFYPTHVNRNRALLDEAISFAQSGGYIDITASTVPEFVESGEVPALQALRDVIEAGVAPSNVSVSSDAGGSLPVYRDGKLHGLRAAGPGVMLESLQNILREQPDMTAQIAASMTRNPASALGIRNKGQIAVGFDADLLILNHETYALSDVLSGGRWLLRHGLIEVPKRGEAS